MDGETYRIVFKGEILPEKDIAVVKVSIAQIFKLKTPQVQNLFTGKPVSVKRGLSLEAATKFMKAFERAGAKVYVVSENGGGVVATSGTEKSEPSMMMDSEVMESEDEITLRREKPAPMTCPKCGLEQPMAFECAGCGVVISKLEEVKKKQYESPVAEKAREAGVALFEGKEMEDEERVLLKEVEEKLLVDGADKMIETLELYKDEHKFWRSHIKLAELLIDRNSNGDLMRAQSILDEVNVTTRGGRPEAYDLLVRINQEFDNKEGIKEAAGKAILLHQLNYNNLEHEDERNRTIERVKELHQLADIEPTYVVITKSGRKILETADEGFIKRQRRDKELPPDVLVVENGMGEGVRLEEWRKPFFLDISFDDNPVSSLAKLIAIIPGILGLIFFWGDANQKVAEYLGSVTDNWVEILAYAFLPVLYLTFKFWRFMLGMIIFVVVCIYGLGFVAGAAAGFIPAYIIASIIWPIYAKRKAAKEAKAEQPKQVATA